MQQRLNMSNYKFSEILYQEHNKNNSKTKQNIIEFILLSLSKTKVTVKVMWSFYIYAKYENDEIIQRFFTVFEEIWVG